MAVVETQSQASPENLPDSSGHFGPFGGSFVPETLVPALSELEKVFHEARKDQDFITDLDEALRDFAGRPTPLYPAHRLAQHLGTGPIYFKREDLLHTGAHKINNAIGQALLAVRMGKRRIIAETGAGQHGVATAAVCARFGLKCVVYMGRVDMERQALNVYRMRLFGAEVVPVDAGQKTLKEAVNEAMRDWVSNVRDTHYILGSALGAHPFPWMVREFHRCIGKEAREQILKAEDRLPDECLACVGGGSNAIGLFFDFLKDEQVKLTGVEAGGHGIRDGEHAARFQGGRLGVLQGTRTFVLQDANGQISLTHSVSAGLDYAAIGPEHAFYQNSGRIRYSYVTDDEVMESVKLCCELEGILPALESTHALAHLVKTANQRKGNFLTLLNMSGRGDKDVQQIARYLPQIKEGFDV